MRRWRYHDLDMALECQIRCDGDWHDTLADAMRCDAMVTFRRCDAMRCDGCNTVRRCDAMPFWNVLQRCHIPPCSLHAHPSCLLPPREWIHFDSLGFTGVHLPSHGLTWVQMCYGCRQFNRCDAPVNAVPAMRCNVSFNTSRYGDAMQCDAMRSLRCGDAM